MEMKHKCNYCNALLSETNSVFVHINRFDKRGKSSRSLWMCCKCWDNTQISEPYMKVKGGEFTCGNCKHLIFKDYKECTGSCRLTRLYRRFTDRCIHEEEMS